jgi:hypothetical protein
VNVRTLSIASRRSEKNCGTTADRAFEEMKRFEFEKGFDSHNTLKQFVYSFYERLAAKADKPATIR